jgi:hypothetical protein
MNNWLNTNPEIFYLSVNLSKSPSKSEILIPFLVAFEA